MRVDKTLHALTRDSLVQWTSLASDCDCINLFPWFDFVCIFSTVCLTLLQTLTRDSPLESLQLLWLQTVGCVYLSPWFHCNTPAFGHTHLLAIPSNRGEHFSGVNIFQGEYL